MDVLRPAVSVLGSYEPEAGDESREANLRKAVRIQAQVPTLIAAWARIRKGKAPIRDRFRAGAAIAAAADLAALRALDRERAAWRDAVAGYDAVLLPTTANLPPKLDRLLADPAHFASENLLALRNPSLANLLGLCALAIPTGIPSCGLMAMTAPEAEVRLLRLGAAMERTLT